MLRDMQLERVPKLSSYLSSLDAASASVTEASPASQSSFTFTSPAAGTGSSPTSLQAPSANPLLESLKKMQNSPGLPPLPGEWESFLCFVCVLAAPHSL